MALLEITLLAAMLALLLTPYPALALLPGIAALASIWSARHPSVVLYGIVALIPFGALRSIGGIELPWLFAGFLAIVLFFRVAIGRTLPSAWASPLWLLVFAYLAVNAISASLSVHPERATHTFFLIVAGYSFVALVMAFLSDEGFKHVLHRVIIWSTSLGSLLSILSYALGISAFTETGPTGPQARFIGGAIDPNNQAIMIIFTMPLIVHLALSARSSRERATMIGLVVFNLLGVLLTQSRSGLVMGFVLLAMLLFHYRHLLRPKMLGAVIAGATLISMVVLAAVPSSFYERQKSLIEWEDTSLLRRTSYLSVGWEAFQKHPIIGSGPGTFSPIYAQSDVTRLFTSKHERRARRAHNTYLEVLVGSGLLGLLLFLGILAFSWRSLVSAERLFKARGDAVTADLVACYRIGFSVLLLFLLMLSDMHHKQMLLAIGVSQVALYLARKSSIEPVRQGLVAAETGSGQFFPRGSVAARRT